MNFRKLLSIGLAACMAVSLVGCGNGAKKDGSYTADLSCPIPGSSELYVYINEFADTVYERTGEKLKINIFPDGTLGGESEVVQMVAAGDMQMTLAGHVAVSLYAPEYGFLMAPFMVTSLQHMSNIFDSDIYAQFQQKLLDEQNLNLIAPYCRGARHLYSNREINSVDDLKGLTIRVPNDSLYLAGWNAQGVNTQALELSELYTSLESGVIEACEGPYDQLTQLNTFEVLDYVYSVGQNIETGAFYASQEWLDTLPDDIESIYLEEALNLMDTLNEMSPKISDAALETIVSEGMEVREFDTAPMFEAANSEWEEMFASTWTVATAEEIRALAD